MTNTYLPLTFNERYFEEKTIVHVPYSLPPEKLPAVSTPAVNILPPAPDLSRHIKPPTVGDYLVKNWIPILGITIGVGLIIWSYTEHQKDEQKNKKVTKL